MDAALDAAALDGGRGTDGGTPPDVDGGAATPGDCAFDGWCWVYPTPFGVALNDVWGSTPDDVWAVGPRGFVAHFDGSAWSIAESPALDEDLRGVHGARADLVFAVGDGGTILRWDGVAWTRETAATSFDLHDIFVGAADEAWAVGEDRVRVRWDGAAWTVHDTEPTFGPYTAIWGASADDIWLGSSRGGFQRWDGAAWSLVSAYDPFPWSIASIWGSGPNDVWAASTEASHRVAHWTGTTWEAVPVPETPHSVWASVIGGRAADDVWLLGNYGRAHWDGSAFSVVDTHSSSSEEPTAMHLFASDGWAVGGSGGIFRNEGGPTWTLAAGATERNLEVHGVARASGGGVWLLGSDGLWRADAAGSVTPVTDAGRFHDAWEAGPNDLWVVGTDTGSDADVRRWDGVSFTPITADALSSTWVNDIWGSAPDDVYLATGDEVILRWNGAAVEVAYDAGSFPPTSITALDGSGPSDVWAVTQHGDILHGDGTSWSVVESDPDVWWRSVRALAPDDVWVGGGGATLWHWDGGSWTPADVPDIQRPTNRGNSPYVVDIVGDATSGLTAITDDGHVLRLVGGRWVRDRPLPMGLFRAAVDVDGSVWVTGVRNVVRRAP